MSLFANPERHAANPPETWTVEGKAGNWKVVADGMVLDTAPTRAKAEEFTTSGFYFDLYAKEARWYAGEPVHGWKPYAPDPAGVQS